MKKILLLSLGLVSFIAGESNIKLHLATVTNSNVKLGDVVFKSDGEVDKDENNHAKAFLDKADYSDAGCSGGLGLSLVKLNKTFGVELGALFLSSFTSPKTKKSVAIDGKDIKAVAFISKRVSAGLIARKYISRHSYAYVSPFVVWDFFGVKISASGEKGDIKGIAHCKYGVGSKLGISLFSGERFSFFVEGVYAFLTHTKGKVTLSNKSGVEISVKSIHSFGANIGVAIKV
ncbi:MAG: hypothetical protein H6845_02105 [Alphaproteobacteria bacterium]|nr:MAG: hypothetical protein H6845_02105 [Alphaproteobacteria bacterium]